MDTHDEIQRLILEVQGKEKVEALNKELREWEQELTGLATKLRNGAMGQEEFAQKARDTAVVMQMVKDQIKEVGEQAGQAARGGGNSLLQFQYILDDLINTSGGFERKLAAISNNIPGFVQSIAGSGSASLAGGIGIVSALLIALAPVAKAAWDAMTGEGEGEDKAARVKEHLREIQAEIKRTHAEFQKLSQSPTDAEKTSAEGIGLYLKDRPKADMARQAVGASATNAEAHSQLTDQERAEFKAAQAASTRTDEELDTAAKVEAARRLGANGDPESIRAEAARMMPGLRQARDDGRARLTALLNAARQRFGEKIVTGATAAGPAGAEARRRLLGVAEGTPGLTDLAGYSPEALAAQEAEYQAYEESGGPGTEAFAERARAGGRGRRKQRRRDKAFDAMAAGWEKEDAAAARQQAREEEREQAAADREAERDDAAWVRGKPARQRRARHNRARAGVVQVLGPDAQGFDPQAIDAMADQALAGMRNGLTQAQATWQAIAMKMRAMQKAMAEFEQMQMQMRAEQSRLFSGTDVNGIYSMMPATW